MGLGGTKKQQENNNGRHIQRVIQLVTCSRHKADIGQACWNLGSNHGLLKAICDHRARKAGCEGIITQDPKYANAPVHNKKEYTK